MRLYVFTQVLIVVRQDKPAIVVRNTHSRLQKLLPFFGFFDGSGTISYLQTDCTLYSK